METRNKETAQIHCERRADGGMEDCKKAAACRNADDFNGREDSTEPEDFGDGKDSGNSIDCCKREDCEAVKGACEADVKGSFESHVFREAKGEREAEDSFPTEGFNK